MLLRRFIKHVNEQNWTAVALDFFIVVFGVYFGMQVSNWNDTRTTRAEEVRTLQAMLADIRATQSLRQEALEETQRKSDALESLALYSVGENEDMSRAELDRALYYGLYDLIYFEPQMITFEELENTGSIDLISNNELRSTLMRLNRNLVKIQNNIDETIQITYEHADHFMIQNTDMQGYNRDEITGGFNYPRWIEPDVMRIDDKAAMQTREFRNIVILVGIINQTFLNRLGSLQSELEEVEKMLTQNLADFGVTE